MRKKLVELLQTFGYNVSLQGSYAEDAELPESFFTYWNYETNLKFVSNKVRMTEYVYRIFFYSRDPDLVTTIFKKVRELLMNNGFYCSGDYDIDADEKFYGAREMEVRYLE